MPPVSPLDAHLGFWLRFVSNHVSAEFAVRVAECGVSVSEWVVLRSLYDPASRQASELAETLGMTKGAISKILVHLEEKRLVARSVVAGDRRAQSLSLTALGRALVPRLAQIADENDAHFFAPLPEKTRALLRAAMETLVVAHRLPHLPTE